MPFLVAYYSRADENYFGGEIRSVEKGNTEIVANRLASFTEASIFKIEQAKPYSANYRECVEQARADMEADARPELKVLPRDIEDWDEIFIGFPNYCGTVPMAVLSFLESFDFSDKVIRPFCTHEGSGMGRALEDIKRVCPDAEIAEGFTIYGSDVDQCEVHLETWLKRTIGPIIW